jgi:dGTPase
MCGSHREQRSAGWVVLFRRLELEALEDAGLAPYAVRSSASRGRRYQEAPDPYRTAFGRDRDRIVHSSAYRRLGNKTQVFVTMEGEYYRTRLTHTEEATQIALTMARALGLNLDLTEAICRAHDLGHAPFGHAGEAALAACMRDNGGFEHNAHTLRVVDLLEFEYPEFPGLNLSWEVREGIAKHGNHGLGGEHDEFLLFPYPSVEAQVADIADSIAYGCHDLDDGLAAGLLHWESFDDLAPGWWAAVRDDLWRSPALLDRDLRRRLLKRHLVNLLVSDAIASTARLLEMQAPESADSVRCAPAPMVGLSPAIDALRTSLHQFLTVHLYRHYHVKTMWVKAQRLIRAVFESLDSDPGQLPLGVQRRIDSQALRRRVICDYIAEMTDRTVVEEHRRLFQFDSTVLP